MSNTAPTTAHEIPSTASTEELIEATKNEIPELTPEILSALSQLDDYGSSSSDVKTNGINLDVIDVLGVFAGIKPATILNHADDELAAILNSLGLHKIYHDGPNGRTFVVSRHPQLAGALSDEFAKHMLDDPEVEQNIGKLLGYPETATEYYIKYASSVRAPEKLATICHPGHLTYCGFVHSPEHWQEEVEAYDKPLEEIARYVLPKTHKLVVAYDESRDPFRNFDNVVKVSYDQETTEQ